MPGARHPAAGAAQDDPGPGGARVRAALERIERDNPSCQALSGVFARRALAEARRPDRADPCDSPVAGQPLVVKDMIDTTPGVCSAGLEVLKDYRPRRDAEVVARLRGAGAIVVGVSTSDCAGFNVRSPAVRHPDAPALTVGGSSGGSAAALRAGFAAAALGTDTGGSVRIPAACCGVVGLKPGFGRVPVAGVRPLSPSLDHVGTLVPRVRDLAVWQPLLDPSLAAIAPTPRTTGARIGVDQGYFADADREVRDAVAAALRTAQAAGMAVRPVALPDPDTVQRVHLVIFAVEAAACYGEAFRDRLPQLPVIIQSLVAYGKDITRQEYDRQCRARAALRARVDAALERVDFLVLPTLPVAPPHRDAPSVAIAGCEHDFTAALIRYTALFNHTGHPALAMPYGRLACGLPASLQVVAPRDGDDALIEFGMALEDLFTHDAGAPGSRQS